VIWYLENYLRSRHERLALEALAASVDWLTPIGWRIDGSLRLIWDADISAPARVFPISLRFPNHFPHSPPLVLPRNEQDRWSSHQYGAGGELCLEYGPDNWRPEITGADMIESAHRLLEAEAGGLNEGQGVASRHKTTLGQDLRGQFGRFLVTRALSELAATVVEGVILPAVLVVQFREEAFIHVLASADLPDGTTWTDQMFPKALVFEGYERPAALLRWPEGRPSPSAESLVNLRAELASIGLQLPDVKKLVLAQGTRFKAYSLNGDDSVTELAVIPEQPATERLDEGHKVLRDRKVSVIGCGSLGSKIATMLARAGVGKFLLVDDDVLLPDNFVRHDLDWREAGTHKADSLARRIQLVNPIAVCEKRKHRLGGQEASGGVETLIESLGESDLIVDCTADASVFNYLCAAVAAAKTPLLWAEVFGGGFGGMIARSRPQLDPDPATMRRIVESWCQEQGKPLPTPTIDYGGTDDTPLIADDADVTVIASHAARMAIDTLIPREPSMYPQPVYLIGLAKGWIFDSVFETYPIDVGPPIVSPAKGEVDPEEAKAELLKITELLTEHKDEDPASGSDS
jgi:sulfur-carrier protein adenylyltransferase/sulfurtransferase